MDGCRRACQKTVLGKALLSGWLVLGCILMITGCNAPMPEQTAVSESTSSAGREDKPEDNENEIPLKESSEYSIAAKNWKIKNYLIEGTDNLYELSMDELSNPASWVVGMKPYGNKFAVIMDNGSSRIKLYLVNPLTMEITASVDLPAGAYDGDKIWINDGNQLEVLNLEINEFMVFDENLLELKRFSFEGVQTDNIVAAKNHKYFYFLDYGDGCIYQYQTDTGKKTKIFADINRVEFGRVLGLLNQDTCLALCYARTEPEDIVYEVRELSTGSILYRAEAEIDGIECEEDSYLLRHFEEGLLEILYGEGNGQTPRVLALKEYGEYRQVVTDLSSKSVVSSMVTEDAGEAYRILAEEQQLDKLDEEGQKVTMFTVNQYNLETGKRQYAMDFYYIQDEDSYFGSCRTLYLEEAECIICCIEGTGKRWLVWDLTKESSKTQDEKKYLYQWQDSSNPDKETLAFLKERAEKIGKENGVEIYFGDEIESCPKDIYDYKVTNNVIRIEKMLDLLEKALGKYPEGMLEQLGQRETAGSKLHIYLSGGITPIDEEGIDSIGVQNTLDGVSFLVLDVNSFEDLENTIYHEIFHAIEGGMNYSEGAFFDSELWDSLNPEGFAYDYSYRDNCDNYNFDYTVADTEHEAYFVDVYSKSFPGEDRARIVEYAMLDAADVRRKYIEGSRLQAKLKYICEQIRKGFDTTGWPEKTSWEQALQ